MLQGLVQAAKHAFADMVFTKKRGNNSAMGYCCAKKKKIPDDPGTETPSFTPNKSGNNAAVCTKTKVTALISPASLRKQSPRNTKSFFSESLGVTELLQVFLQFEELGDKLLRPALVHGRKKLQASADTGTTITEVIDVITMEDDSVDDEVPMELVLIQQKCKQHYQQGEKNHNQSSTLQRHSLRLVSS